eukprot:m.211759 g.211759  ORF g.211759 m.211759 type:complete len:1093 (-) comp15561_c0_seq9:67-3345(-)
MARLLGRDWLAEGSSVLLEKQRMFLPQCVVTSTISESSSALLMHMFAQESSLIDEEHLLGPLSERDWSELTAELRGKFDMPPTLEEKMLGWVSAKEHTAATSLAMNESDFSLIFEDLMPSASDVESLETFQLEELVNIEPAVAVPSAEQLAARLQLKTLEDPFCLRGVPVSETSILGAYAQHLLQPSNLPPFFEQAVPLASEEEAKQLEFKELASAYPEFSLALLVTPETLAGSLEPLEFVEDLPCNDDEVDALEKRILDNEAAHVTEAFKDTNIDESRFAFSVPQPSLFQPLDIEVAAAQAAIEPQAVAPLHEPERLSNEPSALEPLILSHHDPPSPLTAMTALLGSLAPEPYDDALDAERKLVETMSILGEGVCKGHLKKHIALCEYSEMMLPEPAGLVSLLASSLIDNSLNINSLVTLFDSSVEPLTSSEELQLSWDPLRPFVHVIQKISARNGFGLLDLDLTAPLVESNSNSDDLFSRFACFPTTPESEESVLPLPGTAVLKTSMKATNSIAPLVTIAESPVMPRNSLDDFLLLRGKAQPSGPREASAVQSTTRPQSMIQQSRAQPLPPSVSTPFSAPHSYPTTATKSGEDNVVVLGDDNLLADHELLTALESKFSLSILAGQHMRLKDVDIIIDQYSCVVFIPFAEIAKPEGFKHFNDLVLRASLAYCHVYLIARFPHDASISGSFSLALSNIGRLQAILARFPPATELAVDHFTASLHFAFSSEDTAMLVNRAVVFSRQRCKFAINPACGFDWADRSWITERPSLHEAFLLSFPMLNSFSAQLLLCQGSLKTLLASCNRGGTEIFTNLIPMHSLKAFKDAVCLGKGVLPPPTRRPAAPEAPSQPQQSAANGLAPSAQGAGGESCSAYRPLLSGVVSKGSLPAPTTNSAYHLHSLETTAPVVPHQPPARGQHWTEAHGESKRRRTEPAQPSASFFGAARFPDSALSDFGASPDIPSVPCGRFEFEPPAFFDTPDPHEFALPHKAPHASMPLSLRSDQERGGWSYGTDHSPPPPPAAAPQSRMRQQLRGPVFSRQTATLTPPPAATPSKPPSTQTRPLTFELAAGSVGGQTKLRYKGRVPPTPTSVWK